MVLDNNNLTGWQWEAAATHTHTQAIKSTVTMMYIKYDSINNSN